MVEGAATRDDTVLVAMSGGVDSSLAAALLVEQGYQVSGVTMHLWAGEAGQAIAPSRCCSLEAAEGARRVCQQLGIPHHVLNLTETFRRDVVDGFLAEYARGRTPNPCLACNRWIKFGALLKRAQALGFRWLATGHYARIRRPAGGKEEPLRLLRGVDRTKDQSYVLYMLGQEELRRLCFPLGEMTKEEVRHQARQRGLATAGRPESQEICFIPDDDYRRFLAQHLPQAGRPGPIRDLEGHLVGHHRGLPSYTIGQRRGLGLSGRPAPLYVAALDAAENALIVGPEEALYSSTLEADDVDWVAGNWPTEPLQVEARIRYRTDPAPARLLPRRPAGIQLQFQSPQRAITPGQAVVFYRGEEVLGGGTIAASGTKSETVI